MNKRKVVISIYLITIIASFWWYRVIKGALQGSSEYVIYRSVLEVILVIVAAIIIASLICIVYLKKNKRGADK